MSSDDLAYRRSVRNMSIVLAAIVITVFAALFIPPYLFPLHNVYSPSVTLDSPFGFTLHLNVNTTSVAPGGTVLLTGWANSTSDSIENVTAADSWGLPQSMLLGTCTVGWPVELGVMHGHYTQDNYTLGTLSPVSEPACSGQEAAGVPQYFLLEPHSSRALVTVAGTPRLWIIQTSLSVNGFASGSQLQPGVYTAVLADEWGDVLTTNFQVS
ncbi:MAG TPA: hypothetical protein VEB87_06640 [Nitrososphaerales archaeon]|nr:hypothetical protein [Nitrososphaerales archaeon]